MLIRAVASRPVERRRSCGHSGHEHGRVARRERLHDGRATLIDAVQAARCRRATGSQARTSAPSRDAAGPRARALGASRMSSVFGLKASPSSATRLAARAAERGAAASPITRRFCSSLTSITGVQQLEVVARVRRRAASARASPSGSSCRRSRSPRGGSCGPMRRSRPMPSATSHDVGAGRLADVRDLVDEARSASSGAAFAASLIISAEATSRAHDRARRSPRGAPRRRRRPPSSNAPIDDAVGLHEVADGGALGGELRVRDVADVLEPALVETVRAPSRRCRRARSLFITTTRPARARGSSSIDRPDAPRGRRRPSRSAACRRRRTGTRRRRPPRATSSVNVQPLALRASSSSRPGS